MTQYGVQWMDGSYTGGITDKHSLALAYAHTYPGGRVYTVGGEDDPERKAPKSQPVAPVNIWKAPTAR